MTETQAAALPEAPAAGRSFYRLQVGARPGQPAGAGRDQLRAAQHIAPAVTGWDAYRLYYVEGDLSPAEVSALAAKLLADPVSETFSLARWLAEGWQALAEPNGRPAGGASIEVAFLPGVTDAAAENLVRAAGLLGLDVARAATGRRYHLGGALDDAGLHALATGLFANPVIQRCALNRPLPPPFPAYPAAAARVERIPLRAAGPAELAAISRQRRLALDAAEMAAIRAHYQKEGRDPTDVELETLAQTWSEHCVHKSFKAVIHYRGPAGPDAGAPPAELTLDGLLASTIRRATEAVNKPWVRSAFVDNAGVVAFDEQWDLAFKVETHNHPSALEPFGGANTGVGGVIRDVLGVSARPIAVTDVLCFGPPDLPESELPAGVLHPGRVAAGVVAGIEDYGNKMGLPTVNGAILYAPGYTSNPLVYCGCLGIAPRGSHPSGAEAGDLIIALGGRTGRDGLRGATFSSMEMDAQTGAVAGSAVQIGDPIREKQLMEVVLRARDEGLYHAITDCGAGGFSSAVGEMAGRLGARVELAQAPLKYPGLLPWEIWLSEAQERMILAVPPANWPRLQALCRGQDVAAACLGAFEASGRLRLS
ncbi:MAG: AIR synthase-related protein, partial [Candidatus Promineifilaceae bacterium]